ncbi:hypothetical protein [uncultured Roseivirga sp.]|uniref:hypothetical protein n=1 Tax=uncultured Roseivirga sp. TaxID=543088 RepID=UPI0030D9F4D6|tara:strand:- start:81172 stop:82461 length:1290 start_codon:yes stop_codon:yes gene_type:complete
MKARTILYSVLLVFCLQPELWSQQDFSVGFNKDSITVNRSDKPTIFNIDLDVSLLPADSLYESLALEYNRDLSTFLYSDFKLSQQTFGKNQLKNLNGGLLRVYVELKGDSTIDRTRAIFLKLNLIDSTGTAVNGDNIASNKQITIVIKPYSVPNNGGDFDHLAYLGTNFDLAEGKIQSKNLFFASNVLKLPNTPDNKVGFYLSLYGNRAMTQIDSTRRVSFLQNSRLTDSTYRQVRISNDAIVERTSDNLGSYISPLIRLKMFHKSNNPKSKFAFYYAPSLEFVWRRTNELITYKEISRDTSIVMGSAPPFSTGTPSLTRNYNEYAFNAGLIGLFMILENKDLSVRVHGSVGYTSIYSGVDNSGNARFTKLQDIFFSGRAWITEASTGLTLQAEVNNAWKNPRPFFVATISKAFSFKDLGGIFKPITSR